MANFHSLTILIPAFNESEKIQDVILSVNDIANSILEYFEILVVDDGSTDDTYKRAMELAGIVQNLQVIRFNNNRGVGAAYRYGLEIARYDYITLVPGDNAFSKEAISNLFLAFKKCKLVITYRSNTEERSRLRYFLSVLCTKTISLITGKKIRDAHSLYVFPIKLAKSLSFKDDYSYHLLSLGKILTLTNDYIEVAAPLNPKPDLSSGVMTLRVLYLMGLGMIELILWRLIISFKSNATIRL